MRAGRRWFVLAVALVGCGDPGGRCAAAGKAGDWRAAKTACAAAFERGDDRAGLMLARASYNLGDDARAREVLGRIETGPLRADALQLLGSVEDRAGNFEAVRVALEEATALHRSAGDRSAIGRDGHVLAGALWRQGRYRAALEAVQAALDESSAAGDTLTNAYARLVLGYILSSIGDSDGAERAFDFFVTCDFRAEPCL
jgi:tetratricopeptide (TPR) repeat protein